MALNKAIETDSQVTVTYHRLREIIGIFRRDNAATAEVYEDRYLTAEARQSGAAPVESKMDTLELTELEASLLWFVMYRGPLARKYEGAEDVFEPDNPDITPLVTLLTNWELDALSAAITEEKTKRENS
jgi:hypothetical protein